MKDKLYRVSIPYVLPGENEIIKAAKQGRGKFNGYGRMKKEHTGNIAMLIREAGIPSMESVFVNICWVEPNRRRDKDNIDAGKKFIFDALVKAGIIKNDGWGEITGWHSSFTVNKQSPGVIFSVSQIG